ncbi:MAG: hypothetical protein QCI82_10180 [Candidatus Thermoplasmatota archaeon]|nr:hypothetical protein [Candidatus Thermoplasmatota archaeon]
MYKKIGIAGIIIVLLLTGLSGCIESNDEDDNEGVGVEIDETGGWVSTEDASASVYIQEDALIDSKKISIKKSDDAPEHAGVVKDLCFDFGPDGTVFDRKVDIFMNYSDVELPEGVEEYMLGIYKVEDEKFKLVEDCKVDTDRKMISGKIISFSRYVAMGEKVGFIVHTNKNRIANDNMDKWIFSCQLKLKKEGDTSEPTGEPLANTWIELDTYSLNHDGETYGKGDPRKMTSDENGIIRGNAYATTNPNSRYGIAEFTLIGRITLMIVIDVGFDWPYFNHFNETIVGEEWTRYNIVMDGQERTFEGPNPIRIETSPNGKEKFLGPFGAEKVVLFLDNIPPHSRINVEFNIILIGPWMGGESAWMYVDNEPSHEGYVYGSWAKLSLQEDDYPGGYKESDTINSLGYSTTKVVFTDKYGVEHTLDSGDLIRPVSAHVEGHFKSSIELVFTVDERGFNGDSDAGQYWGIDDIYVRYLSGND